MEVKPYSIQFCCMLLLLQLWCPVCFPRVEAFGGKPHQHGDPERRQCGHVLQDSTTAGSLEPGSSVLHSPTSVPSAVPTARKDGLRKCVLHLLREMALFCVASTAHLKMNMKSSWARISTPSDLWKVFCVCTSNFLLIGGEWWRRLWLGSAGQLSKESQQGEELSSEITRQNCLQMNETTGRVGVLCSHHWTCLVFFQALGGEEMVYVAEVLLHIMKDGGRLPSSVASVKPCPEGKKGEMTVRSLWCLKKNKRDVCCD